MGHKGDKTCVFNSIKGCEAAKRLEMGKCASMTDKEQECTNWGIEKVNDRAYCGQHVNSVLLKADNERRAAAKRTELDSRITLYLDWRVEHPSLHDQMPREA